MDGYVTIGTEVDTKTFDAQIEYIESQLQEIEDKLKKADMGFEVGDTQKLEAQYEKLIDKLSTLKQKQADLNRTDLSGIQKNINKVGDSVSNVVKKVARWSLAIFGVRSAYMAVRNAMNTISQYDEQLATDIEYIKNALAFTLEPVVRSIVNLIKQLMFYVAYIVKAWTGKNIFENANKSLKSANKNAQKLKKTLAGFDEMNVLNDSSSSSGVSGVTTPSFDLSQIQGEVPEWIRWITDNKDLILSTIAGITAGLVAWSVGLSGLKALGIGVAIAGITYAIINLIKFLQDPTFENFIGILEGISVAVLGVAVAIGAWPVAVAGAIAFVVIEIVKHFDEIMGLFNKLINWLDKNVLGALRKLFGPLGDIIYAPIKYVVEVAKGAFESFYGGIKKVVTGIVKLFKGDFKNGIKNVFEGLKGILLAPINALISGINSLIKGVNKIDFDVPDWVPGIGGKKWGFNIPTIPKLAVGGIVNMPGRGINYANANIGERGAEGVIPLTNTQMMEQLGETIGKYITINATITNTMNGRIISRELQKVKNNTDFATNR